MKNSTFTHCTLSVLILLLFATAGFSQSLQQRKQVIQKDEKVQAVEMSPERGTPHTIRFDTKKTDAYRPQDVRQVLQKHLQLRQADQLQPVSNTSHVQGMSVARYQQFYQGVKVAHGQFAALVKAEKLEALSGEFYEIDGLNTSPTLTEGQALNAARAYIGADEYVWEHVARLDIDRTPAHLRNLACDVYDMYFPKGELVIVDDYNTPEVDVDLAWKFNIYAQTPVSRNWVYVNAHTGEVMLKDAIIKHAEASVQTRYNGIKTIGTTMVEGANPNPEYFGDEDYYILLDESRGNGIQTYDMNGIGGAPISVPLLYELAADFVDDDNIWSHSEHVRDPAPTIEEAINDDVALDAHWGASMVYDYWLERHNRLSYDDNNAKINSYVHYGEGYDNAFWNGSAMTYGDGSYKDFGNGVTNGSFSPLTSLDVCAHEVGHAVCSNTADLVYQRESGAMNEGFSDIWAACLENYIIEIFADESFDYKPFGIGEQVDQRAGFNNLNKALRWMDDPKLAGDPDTYGGAFWTNPECGEPTLANDYCGVHSNSGVLNKWFYLLTVGSGDSPDDGVNDNGDAYTVNGLGFAKSELIAFGTEVQLTPNATFAQARAASISYARAAYGPCSPEEEAVTNAWYAVGVGTAYECQSGTTSSGFFVTQQSVNEAADGDGFCGDSKIFEVSLFVNAATDFDLGVGGTATLGSDYTLSTTNIFHAGSGFVTKTITVTIIDDAAAENDETIVLTIPVEADPVVGSEVYTLTLRDDDVAPVIGVGQKSLLYERFLTTNIPTGWAEVNTLSSLNKWYYGSYQGRAFISATGVIPIYEGENNQTDIILRSPLLDARGLANVAVSFDWTAGGETDVALGGGAPFDFARLTYSFDGVKFYDIDPVMVGDNFGTTPASDTYSGDISHLVGNRQFYLGWRWINDPLVGTAYSFSFDNVRVNASTRQVESDLGHAGEEYLGPNATVYFYSADDGELLATVTNNSSHDFGCTTLYVEREGNGGKNWYTGGKSTAKAIRFDPEFASSNADVDVTIYLSQDEMTGWENASGSTRQQLDLYNTTATSIEGASASNTSVSDATYVAIHKTPATVIAGGFTAKVTGTLGGILLANDPLSLPLGTPNSNMATASFESISLSPNPASSAATLTLPAFEDEQLVEIMVMDLGGQLVWKTQRHAFGGEQVQLEVTDFSSGIYLVSVRTREGFFAEKLIVR